MNPPSHPFVKTALASLLGCLAILPLHAAEIANSIAEFSGTQGNNGWHYGWRNFTADGGGDEAYDPLTAFIPFTAAQWNGSRHVLGGNPPWTFLDAEASHPNGTNNGAEHWVIRRWVADEITTVTPLRATLHARMDNANGGGVTGALYQNGLLKFTQAVPGNDITGYTLDFFLNVLPGDKIDFVLTPVNADGVRNDGWDGSFFSMLIDDDLGTGPFLQPDATEFFPASGADSDADGLLDFWETTFSPEVDPADKLLSFSSAGDFDMDGLTDLLEYTRGADPTRPDTDGDGLTDFVETKTGNFAGNSNTGSDPAKADSDGDGLGDGAEVNATPATNPNLPDTDADGFADNVEKIFGSNPILNTDTPLSLAVADSVTEFSGVQGQDGWEYGYRNLTLSGHTLNYDPVSAFIPIENFTGSWAVGGNPPWTFMDAGSAHPNGINNGEEHWTMRRWKAAELAGPTAVNVIWHLRKTNQNGDGVTGAVFLNGKILDSKVIAGNDGVGVTRNCYLVLRPTDILDLVLTPTGLQEGTDGSDGSGNWMRVDQRIPALPVSSNGAFFAAPGGADVDGDGLADAWEIYVTATTDPPAAGTTTVLTAAAADGDQDGLTNLQEQTLGTDPQVADTDGDGLSDGVESGTGDYVSAANTGTHPRRADSDEDGLSDPAELDAVQLKSNPWLANTDGDFYNDANELRRDADPATATEYVNGHATGGLAHSIVEFTGSQGPPWSYGYRDLTADGGESNYNPAVDFLPIDNFDGNAWVVGGNPPWTGLWMDGAHPNGPNNTNVHWAIRRWEATAAFVPAPTPLAFWWHVRKSVGTDTDGVTGALYLNGMRLDSAAIHGTDVQGVTRIVYAEIKAGDVVDLALQSNGTGLGDFEGFDYSDGSFTTLRVASEIPAGAVQPDGSPFPAVAAGSAFQIATVTRDPVSGAVTLTWPSATGQLYDVRWSETMTATSWALASPVAGVPGTAGMATFTDATIAPALPVKPRIFYRVHRR